VGRDVAPQGRLDEPAVLHFFLCRFGGADVSFQGYLSGLFISKDVFVCELCKQGKMA
jgi:hypothetical protein